MQEREPADYPDPPVCSRSRGSRVLQRVRVSVFALQPEPDKSRLGCLLAYLLTYSPPPNTCYAHTWWVASTRWRIRYLAPPTSLPPSLLHAPPPPSPLHTGLHTGWYCTIVHTPKSRVFSSLLAGRGALVAKPSDAHPSRRANQRPHARPRGGKERHRTGRKKKFPICRPRRAPLQVPTSWNLHGEATGGRCGKGCFNVFLSALARPPPPPVLQAARRGPITLRGRFVQRTPTRRPRRGDWPALSAHDVRGARSSSSSTGSTPPFRPSPSNTYCYWIGW